MQHIFCRNSGIVSPSPNIHSLFFLPNPCTIWNRWVEERLWDRKLVRSERERLGALQIPCRVRELPWPRFRKLPWALCSARAWPVFIFPGSSFSKNPAKQFGGNPWPLVSDHPEYFTQIFALDYLSDSIWQSRPAFCTNPVESVWQESLSPNVSSEEFPIHQPLTPALWLWISCFCAFRIQSSPFLLLHLFLNKICLNTFHLWLPYTFGKAMW